MESGGAADEPPFDAVQSIHCGGIHQSLFRQLLPGQMHHASAVRRQTGGQRGRQPHRQAAPVQHMIILGKIADKLVFPLIRCDQAGEEEEFFPARKDSISSPRALLRATTGTRPSSVRRWS